MPIGYSGTPLIKKLGIGAGSCVAVLNKPTGYESLLGELPVGAKLITSIGNSTTLVHVFATERSALLKQLTSLRTKLQEATPIWVSWPKKSAKVPTDLTEDTIREVALPLGYVDIKVCAVSEVWSGLKLVVRKELRSNSAA
jgi:hypothetical protein